MNNYISIRLNLLSITDKWLSNHPIIQILIYFFISVFIYVDVSTPHSISYSVPSYIVENNISKYNDNTNISGIITFDFTDKNKNHYYFKTNNDDSSMKQILINDSQRIYLNSIIEKTSLFSRITICADVSTDSINKDIINYDDLSNISFHYMILYKLICIYVFILIYIFLTIHNFIRIKKYYSTKK